VVQIVASLGGLGLTAIVEQIEHAQLKPRDIRTGRLKTLPYLTRSSWVAYASTNGVASLQERDSDVTPKNPEIPVTRTRFSDDILTLIPSMSGPNRTS
jgi:hypothetical protein